VTPEELARLFHETYERLAPHYGYKTREASAVPWSDVPANNKALMINVADDILAELDRTADTSAEDALHNETCTNFHCQDRAHHT
jgi:hypothetical protein